MGSVFKDRKICFGSLQSQRWTPNSIISLCDSMDLLVVGTQLRRTMNWEQNNLGTLRGTVFAWHEKLIVAAQVMSVSLYSLEGILAAGNEAEREEMALLITTDLKELGRADANESVQQVCFRVAAKPHRKWIEHEENHNVSIGPKSKTSNRSLQIDYSHLLEGPTAFDEGLKGKDTANSDIDEGGEVWKLAEMPTKFSRLSMLAVATSQRLHLFAYGHYPLVINLPLFPIKTGNHAIALSHDLSHTIVTADHQLMVYTVPSFASHRIELQVLASQYPRIFAILRSMQANLPEIASAWKISLKPINLKMQALTKLLIDYNCLEEGNDHKTELRRLLVRYIVLGAPSPDIENAVDQFFTGNNMNDQLVVRLERSLQSALANIQEKVRTQLVQPSLRLIEECQTIWGLTTTSDLFSPCHDLANYLLECSFSVWNAAQECQTQLTQDQNRLTKDWVPWLRSTAAQIKAVGTAQKSVQRQNAASRRVDDHVVKRVVGYLKEGNEGDGCDRSTIEHMLNLNFALSVQPGRDSSLPAILTTAQDWAEKLFLRPRSLLECQVTALSLQSPGTTSRIAQTAVVTRMDGDGQMFQGRLSSVGARQWCVTATPMSQSDCLLLNAIPMTTANSVKHEDEMVFSAVLGDQILSCRLQFPHSISDVSFYNDDGRSSFGDDKKKYGEEGTRQKLGVLLQPMQTASNQENVELWLLPYDDLPFDVISLSLESDSDFDAKMVIPPDTHRSFPVPVVPLPSVRDQSERVCYNGTCAKAWTRSVAMKRREVPTGTEGKPAAMPSPRLLLSGPRGVGVVHSATLKSGSTLEIFDLEDNEGDNESDEDRDASMEVE